MPVTYVVFKRTSHGITSEAYSDWQPRSILPEGTTLLEFVTDNIVTSCLSVKSIDRDAVIEFVLAPADESKHRSYPQRVQFTLRAIKGTLPE